MAILSVILFVIATSIVFLVLLFCYIVAVCFKPEEIPDIISVSSESSYKSNENKKFFLTRKTIYKKNNIIFELPDLNLTTYIKETKKYRNHFQTLCYFDYYIEEWLKSNLSKKISLQEEIEILF